MLPKKIKLKNPKPEHQELVEKTQPAAAVAEHDVPLPKINKFEVPNEVLLELVESIQSAPAAPEHHMRPNKTLKVQVPQWAHDELAEVARDAGTAPEDSKIVKLNVRGQALKELLEKSQRTSPATENKESERRKSLRLAARSGETEPSISPKKIIKIKVPEKAHQESVDDAQSAAEVVTIKGMKKSMKSVSHRAGKHIEVRSEPILSKPTASAPAGGDEDTLSDETLVEAAPRPSSTRLLTRYATPARSSPLRESAGGKAKKHDRDNDSASSSLSPVAPRTPSNMEVDDKAKAEEKSDDESSSDDDGRPPPQPRPQANTFGDDPSTFPDPTVYEILSVKPGMTEDEIKEIYSVASYPKSDLADLIAGDPPDKDFSSAKPTNQINFSTFSTYIEPYFRPFTEEDLAFLRERGDRVTPFVMPKRGKKHYSEIWAEEDGAMSIDSPSKDKLPPNQPRGSIENMDDDLAESDKLSVGPLLSRLLSAMRPEHRAPPAEPQANGVNGDGDTLMNGVSNFDSSFGEPVQQSLPGQTTPNGTVINGATNGNGVHPSLGEPPLPPATQMPESTSEAWKKATHPKLDYQQVDERLKQELRHIGFLPSLPGDGSATNNNAATNGASSGANGASSSAAAGGSSNAGGPDPSSTADYDGAFDDEVAARLRLLQTRLREQALVNGARKARLTELVKERMAHQEYQTILEDLDSQVQAAYLKRTRTMGKKPKKARPGAAQPAAAAGGLARPGIGDLTKTLMERRRRWIENIGTVFDGENLGKVPRVEDEGSSIFRGDVMGELLKRERENWEEEVEDE